MVVDEPRDIKSLSKTSIAQTESIFPRIGAIDPWANLEFNEAGGATIVTKRAPSLAFISNQGGGNTNFETFALRSPITSEYLLESGLSGMYL